MADTFLERVLVWEKAKSALDTAKTDEHLAREAIVEVDFAGRSERTTTKTLPDGRVVKCLVDTEYKADPDAARTCIAKLEALGEAGKLIAGRLFKWKPDVMVGELKKLDKTMRKIADKAVTPKDRRPSISVE